MATPKQEKLIKLLIDNYGKKGETRTLSSLMIEAGYSEKSALNPQLIIGADVIQDELQSFAKQLDQTRRKAISYITDDKLEKASARDNAYIADIMTKNHQLLTGQETERKGVTIEITDYKNVEDTDTA